MENREGKGKMEKKKRLGGGMWAVWGAGLVPGGDAVALAAVALLVSLWGN